MPSTQNRATGTGGYTLLYSCEAVEFMKPPSLHPQTSGFASLVSDTSCTHTVFPSSTWKDCAFPFQLCYKVTYFFQTLREVKSLGVFSLPAIIAQAEASQ